MRTQSILKGGSPYCLVSNFGRLADVWVVSVTERTHGFQKTTVIRRSDVISGAPDAWDDAGLEASRIATQLD